MSENSTAIVSKVPPSLRIRRTGAHVIKNAGVGCGDCVEQIKVAKHT